MANKRHILIVDDDTRLRRLLHRFLSERGCLISDVGTATEGLCVCDILAPDAIVLDVMLPDMDGHEFSRRLLTRKGAPPVLMLSALARVEDRVRGLKNGAIDYLTKPFDPEELYLRLTIAMKTSLNGTETIDSTFDAQGPVETKDISRYYTEMMRLTDHESRLLAAFLQRSGIVMSRAALRHMCQLVGGDRAIDVLVLRLRRKLETLPEPRPEIKTIRRQGYMFFSA